jgi:hypothetical protein
LLRQIAPAVPAAPGTIVRRGGQIIVTGRITESTHLIQPVRCEVTVQQSSPYAANFERYSTEATFQGHDGTCVVRIPFRWENADDSYPIEVYVDLSSADVDKRTGAGPRYTSFYFPFMPLPAQKSTTNLSFNVVM